MQKRSKRKKTKYPALDPQLNLKTRFKEISDIDYLDKLNDEEKAWLNKFMAETVNADFRHREQLYKTSGQKKELYKRNNARNRDVYTKAEAQNKITNLLDVGTEKLEIDGFEDMMICKIDLENSLKKK